MSDTVRDVVGNLGAIRKLPDFSIKNVRLYNIDCMAFMKDIPDNYYELAIVDPEYGIGADKPSTKPNICKQKNGKILAVRSPVYKHKDWDCQPADNKYFDELIRISQNQIIWGVNYYDYKLIGGRIIWDKLNGESDQFDCEIAYCSLNNRTDIIRYLWAGMFQGLCASKKISEANIQQGNKILNEKRIHPTQKPVALYKWLLTNYAKSGDKIIDTHGGSFSSACACLDLGFEFDGCEIDQEYFQNAVERLKNNVQEYFEFSVS